MTDPAVVGLIADIVHSGRTAGVPVGTVGPATTDGIRAAVDDGYAFTLLSNDASLLGDAARTAVTTAREAMNRV